MSEYLMLLALLLFGVAVEAYLKRTPKRLYVFVMIIMGSMLIFRYGQGTDYFGYKWIYEAIPTHATLLELADLEYGADYGWRLLCMLSKRIGISFELFVVCVSVVEWVLFVRFIENYCKRKMLSLLLCYHTLYLTYMFSALRNGLVICIFLGVLLQWYLEKKYFKYVVGCVVCSFFHAAALLGLAVVLIKTSIFDKPKTMLVGVLCSIAIGAFLSTGAMNDVLQLVLPARVAYYFRKVSVSFALIERICMYALVLSLYTDYLNKCARTGRSTDQNINILMKIYTLSVMTYGGLMWLSVCARISYLFKVTEIILLCAMLETKSKLREVIVMGLVCFATFMCLKNIDSYISQGRYYSDVTVINYPHFSLFEKDEVSNYRQIIYTFSDND